MNETSPQVAVIAGPNGAGKTSLTPFLLRDRFSAFAFVNADAIASGLSAFEPDSVAIEAGRVMLRRLHELSERKESFAFETTLATRSYAPWLKQLRPLGYEVHLVFVWLRSAELAIECRNEFDEVATRSLHMKSDDVTTEDLATCLNYIFILPIPGRSMTIPKVTRPR
jgi:hypothetical protein